MYDNDEMMMNILDDDLFPIDDEEEEKQWRGNFTIQTQSEQMA